MMTVQMIAMLAHEMNRRWCELHGDSTQLPWHAASSWQRESAIRGVQYAMEHPEASPADQHEQWLRDKLADGWVYGPVKDAERKTHPCCVPYEELPLHQRVKDGIFQAVVRGCSGAPEPRLAGADSDRCPRCNSPDPGLHPAVQHEGEVQVCQNPFHGPARPHEVFVLFRDSAPVGVELTREDAQFAAEHAPCAYAGVRLAPIACVRYVRASEVE